MHDACDACCAVQSAVTTVSPDDSKPCDQHTENDCPYPRCVFTYK